MNNQQMFVAEKLIICETPSKPNEAFSEIGLT